MVGYIFKKDWTLLWPLVVLVTAIQVAFDWAVYKAGFFGSSPVAGELVRLLSGAWMVGVVAVAVAVVHEDAIPGAEQDWLIRPLARTDLLLAKLIFVLVTVCVPMLVVNFAHALAMGFPAMQSLGDAVYKELYVFVCLLVPAMAMAAVTRNMAELLVFAAALVVLFAATLGASAIVLGANSCPTCDTAVSWLQHLLQHAGVLVGSALILALQYYRRRTQATRVLAAVGVVMLVLVQLPWTVAFAIQSWLGGSAAAASAVTIRFDTRDRSDAVDEAAQADNETGRPNIARRATQALLHGNVGGAVENLKRFTHPEDVPVLLSVPLQVSGTSADQFLLADRAKFSLVDDRGAALYRGTNASRGSVPLIRDPADAAVGPGSILQTVEIPDAAYRRARTRSVRLNAAYSLTLMTLVAEHKMSALDGEVRTPELGLCRSKADPHGIRVRCQQIGRGPVCYSATLYGPDGRHNPDGLECSGDFRPYLPSATDILALLGVDLPTRDPTGLAHYAVDVSDLPQSYILLKAYAPRAHFVRTLSGFPVHLSE